MGESTLTSNNSTVTEGNAPSKNGGKLAMLRRSTVGGKTSKSKYNEGPQNKTSLKPNGTNNPLIRLAHSINRHLLCKFGIIQCKIHFGYFTESGIPQNAYTF
jgi:hypothetical protein